MIRLNSNFLLHDTGDEKMIVSVDDRFHGIIKLNSTAAFIVGRLVDGTTRTKTIEDLLEKYDVTYEIAEADVNKVIDDLQSIGAIDEN